MGVKFSSSDFHQIYKPSYCELRYWLLNVEKSEKKELCAFDQLIMKLGIRHEKTQLDLIDHYVDLSNGTMAERSRITSEQLKLSNVILYQPVLNANIEIGGEDCNLVGIPDFIIIENNKTIIRDVKLAKRITEKDHPEILFQLQLYGLIFSLITSETVNSLQVLAGDNKIIEVVNSGPEHVKNTLLNLLRIKFLSAAPYSPVGVSKCNGCLYNESCWKDAVDKKDVALIPGVDQSLTLSLREKKITDYESLLKNFDENSLSEFKRPWGTRLQKVGKTSVEILRNASALLYNSEIVIKSPQIPKHENYVMFDLEGLPPYVDEIEKVYLWGMQVYGTTPTKYTASLAGFGEDGDREGWVDFLREAKEIIDKYGDIPWVHWHSYEKTKINLYKKRFGDPSGVGQRVVNNLLDLLPITEQSIALPIYSYSLKVIEKYLGFKRSQDEYGGSWSIAKYIEAVESLDEELRNKYMSEVLKYNEDDLAATWLVTEWLLKKE